MFSGQRTCLAIIEGRPEVPGNSCSCVAFSSLNHSQCWWLNAQLPHPLAGTTLRRVSQWPTCDWAVSTAATCSSVHLQSASFLPSHLLTPPPHASWNYLPNIYFAYPHTWCPGACGNQVKGGPLWSPKGLASTAVLCIRLKHAF